MEAVGSRFIKIRPCFSPFILNQKSLLSHKLFHIYAKFVPDQSQCAFREVPENCVVRMDFDPGIVLQPGDGKFSLRIIKWNNFAELERSESDCQIKKNIWKIPVQQEKSNQTGQKDKKVELINGSRNKSRKNKGISQNDHSSLQTC